MIYCPRCRKVMEYQHTLAIQGAGPGQHVLYTCSPCRVRCTVETHFYYDGDSSEPQSGDANG